MLDGYHVRGLDQIGLSQKAGPVVSDVRLSRRQPTATNRLGQAQADLLLAFDQLVAASDRGLLTASEARTTVVGSTSTTPTGAMITHPEIAAPSPSELAARIASRTRDGQQHWADAQAITNELFGSSTTANIFVIGMAVQAGCLPIGTDALEQAISLNGVAVDANLAAYRWGRMQVASPATVEAVRDGLDRPGTPEPVLDAATAARIGALGLDAAGRQRIELYATELREWGGARDVAAWLDVVEAARRAEAGVAEHSTALTCAVAAGLFKLTAYKDEYEVARLMTHPDGQAEAVELAGVAGTITWRLHPPMLRALGLDSKVKVGAWATPGVRALAAAKRLRGTLADPFRWAEVRKAERALPGEYRSAMSVVFDALRGDRLGQAVAVAELPDMVRGFEEIKLESVERFRAALSESLAGYTAASDPSLDR